MPTTRTNYKTKGFVSKNPSLTIPGQVLTIKAIAERFRRGQGTQTYPAVYNPDLPPGIENLNKLERIDLLRSASANVRNLRQSLQDASDIRKKDEAEKKYKADVEKTAKAIAETQKVSEP